MEKVLFLMRYPLDGQHHLKNKFNGQMQACVNLGYSVFYLGYDRKLFYLINYSSKQRIPLLRTHFSKLKKYRNTICILDLYCALAKALDVYSFKYIYMRLKPVGRVGFTTLDRAKKQGSLIIVEIPAFQSNEKELSIVRTLVRRMINKWTQEFYEIVDLYTLIGPDCSGQYKGRPALNIMNGVCLEQLSLRDYKPQREVHLLALGSMRIWHAYDRLINGMVQYTGSTPIIIDMVGGDNDGSLESWKKLVKKNSLENKVIFHGPMYGKKLDYMFDIADIGVATLGLHRNKMSSGSVLKLGEYTARGLPFVYGYNDKTFDGTEVFAMKVAEDDSPIDVDRVLNWALKMRAHPKIGKEMRDFAREKMSWESEFKKIFEKVNTLQR